MFIGAKLHKIGELTKLLRKKNEQIVNFTNLYHKISNFLLSSFKIIKHENYWKVAICVYAQYPHFLWIFSTHLPYIPQMPHFTKSCITF